jgi:hypothetical protein
MNSLLNLITAQDGQLLLRTENYLLQKHFMFLLTMTPQSLITLILTKQYTKCRWSNTTLRRKPTSKGFFFGDFEAIFNKVHGIII